MKRLNVDDLMSAEPVTIAPGASLDEAMELMDARGVRHLPVIGGGALVGLIGERDLLQATGWLPSGVRDALDAPKGSVGDFMHTTVLSVESGDGLERAASIMLDRDVGCLPVLTGGKLAGTISELDILNAYVAACDAGRLTASEDAPVAETMTETPLVAAPDELLEDVVERLREESFRHAPVVSEGELVGVLSDRDLRRAVGEGNYGGTRVDAYMSAQPVTIGPQERASAAARRMLEERISSLMVTDGASLVGILTTADLLGPCAMALQSAPAG